MKEKQRPSLVLSFRLPTVLIKKIDEIADAEIRNRVNMVEVLLREALDARDAKVKVQSKK
jgi:metal-responsive CopG/Arc/MetJ family transcriptional regulator